jgi:hypothetical protein
MLQRPLKHLKYVLDESQWGKQEASEWLQNSKAV